MQSLGTTIAVILILGWIFWPPKKVKPPTEIEDPTDNYLN